MPFDHGKQQQGHQAKVNKVAVPTQHAVIQRAKKKIDNKAAADANELFFEKNGIRLLRSVRGAVDKQHPNGREQRQQAKTYPIKITEITAIDIHAGDFTTLFPFPLA